MVKADKKGILLPPAVGYSLGVMLHLFARYRISLKYLPRTFITLLINLVNLPFRWVEKKFINPRFSAQAPKQDPIFIIGHWRSGTTHLHNILCRDPKMAYTSTFQSVFPDTLYSRLGRPLFEGFARLLIPGKRKGDNVVLGTELPQEEEFALGDKIALCYYYCWMFPRHMKEFYHRAVRFEGVSDSQLASWLDNYEVLMSKAIDQTAGEYFLSKNPVNTARVATLLKRFPGARFIHIHRDPVEVYLSTRNFFHKMLPHLQLQTADFQVLEKDLIEIYSWLMKDFLEQRRYVPKGQLIEVSYADLESRPMELVNDIYATLGIELEDRAKERIKEYIRSKKSYHKNRYAPDPVLEKGIREAWGFAMEEWNYSKKPKTPVDKNV